MKRPLESERDGKERVGGRKRGLSKRGREGIKGRPPHFYVLSVLVSDTRRQGEESRGNIYQMHPCVMHGQGYDEETMTESGTAFSVCLAPLP